MEDGLREQAGGTKKLRKVTQKPKIKSPEETTETNEIPENKITTATTEWG